MLCSLICSTLLWLLGTLAISVTVIVPDNGPSFGSILLTILLLIGLSVWLGIALEYDYNNNNFSKTYGWCWCAIILLIFASLTICSPIVLVQSKYKMADTYATSVSHYTGFSDNFTRLPDCYNFKRTTYPCQLKCKYYVASGIGIKIPKCANQCSLESAMCCNFFGNIAFYNKLCTASLGKYSASRTLNRKEDCLAYFSFSHVHWGEITKKYHWPYVFFVIISVMGFVCYLPMTIISHL